MATNKELEKRIEHLEGEIQFLRQMILNMQNKDKETVYYPIYPSDSPTTTPWSPSYPFYTTSTDIPLSTSTASNFIN